MKALILGIDGYLGWALALRLVAKGHEVMGIDNLSTRRFSTEVGSDSAFPLPSPKDRVEAVKRKLGGDIEFVVGDAKDKKLIEDSIRRFKPDVIVHFAEQRSAPYSMKDYEHAWYTLENNLKSTLSLLYAISEIDPTIHLLKMGTMGEYGTPNFDIPESPFVKALIGGKEDVIPTPKWGGSYYHWSKIFDTYLILFKGRLSGLTVTDIMQGPVYGTKTEEINDEELRTRFDFDETWGTVINRYCVEAVLGLPLTPYGKGKQTRGFISLEDSVEALRLLIENPPKQGEYRVVNQFAEIYNVRQLAEIVKDAAEGLGLKVDINHVKNPRFESEDHYYNPEIKVLPSLGFKPKRNIRDETKVMIKDLLPYKERLERFKHTIMPKTIWK
ncbi:NAD-dependent epimerase/dehydratase family protein [Metallosphaera tengchongensis]|uniref:NAD-dependent epimerase/dehydratase family protein n=1 Tax=Metallosphaera tengchongensis TaxID=1532350 RepID=A0A6N0NV47_9CREN|nr:UDP-sulfoquinovose synthase [Metallosphaera tengchongensis]QKR00047.1 NAD-dependent epimerase/dehydratase family protein [Metallosphaera tengchongensis]